ncbi:hypothetical protein [Dyadobacter sp. LHD-138]|uniref:hypothetical protein n=1 Tax=Dyadobacter sp. LHD-138 TaxID=3071413 RepID=UPI0027DF3072|nr:hypothetical protein [Dyadobacter sp. LHD-138]MDQ6482162.1 hypothetical protein [Dyadobacter sp. LHD-138]
MAKEQDDKADKDKIDEVAYPEGYEYIRDIVKPYRDDIWKLNEQIDKLDQQQLVAQTSQPVLAHNPPGFTQSRFVQGTSREYLENKREEIYQQLDNRTKVEIKELDSQDQKSIKEAVRDDVDRNPFRNMDKEELKELKNENKDLSMSQNYSDMLLKNEKQEKEINPVEQKPSVDKPQEPAVQPSASERYNRTLSFTKSMENAKDITSKEKEPSPAPTKQASKEDR